jgi:iron complex transport system substrate-binding protein
MRRGACILALVATLAAAACSSTAQTAAPASAGPSAAASPSAGPITVTDALGRQITFATAPRRIVLAGRAVFMIADAIYMFPEASSRIVAMSTILQNKLAFVPVVDPTYSAKTIIDGAASSDTIAALRPDVVITKSSNAESVGKPLITIGIKVVYVDFETPEQYTRDLGTLGLLLDDTARARRLIDYFSAATSKVTTAVSGVTEAQKPKALLLYYSNKSGNVAFNVAPLTFIQTTEVGLAAGLPAWKDAKLGSGWTTVTLEQIAAWDADQIYVVVYSGNVNDVVTGLKADSKWQALRAVKQNALYAFPADYYSWDQSDTRWILGLTWLASKIHPDRFAGLDLDATIRDFYSTLYGMDKVAYDAYIKPNLTGSLP